MGDKKKKMPGNVIPVNFRNRSKPPPEMKELYPDAFAMYADNKSGYPDEFSRYLHQYLKEMNDLSSEPDDNKDRS